MTQKKEISFSPANIQKQGKYYRIVIPPDFIAKEFVDPNVLYKAIVRSLTDDNEIPISPVKLQKQGDYYRFAIPPDFITKKIIDPEGLYSIILEQLEK